MIYNMLGKTNLVISAVGLGGIPLQRLDREKAVETAYKAVMKPKEGTILTVAKGASMKARELADAGETDMAVFIKEVIAHAEYVLSQTPEMLPVLKQAGGVGSGGQGLIEVLHGAYDAFMGKEVDFSMNEPARETTRQTLVNAKGTSKVLSQSYVTYSCDAKIKILGVKKDTLDCYSVYSKEVAKEMVEGLQKITKANICISVTGEAESSEPFCKCYYGIIIAVSYTHLTLPTILRV